MPHAEFETTNGEMSAPTTNGDTPHSKVLSHLRTFPVVQDSLDFYKSNPYGAKSLSFAQQTYARFVAPLHPYLQTPYSYLSPYLSRADELGDNGLSKVESKFPIVKQDTNKLKETVVSLIGLPIQVAGKGKDYVLGRWQEEYQRTGGEDGLVKSAKAILSTELRIGHDGYTYLLQYWSKGKKEVNKKIE